MGIYNLVITQSECRINIQWPSSLNVNVCFISCLDMRLDSRGHKHNMILQTRQTKDAKFSRSDGGNGLFIWLYGQGSFVLVYTYSCLRIFRFQFIVRQSPVITSNYPPVPSESYHISCRLLSSPSIHFIASFFCHWWWCFSCNDLVKHIPHVMNLSKTPSSSDILYCVISLSNSVHYLSVKVFQKSFQKQDHLSATAWKPLTVNLINQTRPTHLYRPMCASTSQKPAWRT